LELVILLNDPGISIDSLPYQVLRSVEKDNDDDDGGNNNNSSNVRGVWMNSLITPTYREKFSHGITK
jgi:hypothetical protein